jgi:hypothetical protein
MEAMRFISSTRNSEKYQRLLSYCIQYIHTLAATYAAGATLEQPLFTESLLSNGSIRFSWVTVQRREQLDYTASLDRKADGWMMVWKGALVIRDIMPTLGSSN